MIFGGVRDYAGKRRQRQGSVRMMALLGACLFLASVGGAAAETCSGLQNIALPDVAIGHKVGDETEWKTGGELEVEAGTPISFHAMEVYDPAPLYRELNSWVDVDASPTECWTYDESVTCSWWWHYAPPNDDADATGFQVNKTFNSPGTRSMRLLCKDTGAWIDDDDTFASMSVTIPLTLEIDVMAGGHGIPTGNLPTAWERVGYKLEIDPDHETIECIEYITERYPTFGEKIDFFEEHEKEGCHLYLMGIHRWSQYDPLDENSDPFGMTLLWTWGTVCACTSRGLPEALREVVALHENGAHDATIGKIEHCARDDDGCNANEYMNGSLFFCSNPAEPSSNEYCLHELKHYLESHLND